MKNKGETLLLLLLWLEHCSLVFHQRADGGRPLGGAVSSALINVNTSPNSTHELSSLGPNFAAVTLKNSENDVTISTASSPVGSCRFSQSCDPGSWFNLKHSKVIGFSIFCPVQEVTLRTSGLFLVLSTMEASQLPAAGRPSA